MPNGSFGLKRWHCAFSKSWKDHCLGSGPKMRVLVTGGAGYIGSHTVLALQERGYDVLILDNFTTGHRRLAGNRSVIEVYIGNRATVLGALENVDAIMHFAAHAYVGESVTNPRKYFENNVEKSIALLGAALDRRVRFFVFSSSCAVYGVPELVPITENLPRLP